MKAIIGHVIFNVKEFNESEKFYDQLLIGMGFKVDHVDESDFGKMKSYRQGEHNLWLRFDKNSESEEFVRNIGLDHLAFELQNESEVDQVFELVKKLRVKITREPRKYPEYSESYYAFYFRDPNGIPLEVYLQ